MLLPLHGGYFSPCHLSFGESWCQKYESILLFFSMYVISVFHSSTVISHLDSLGLMEVFCAWMVVQIDVSMRG